MTSWSSSGVPVHELPGMNAKMVFQPEDIIGKQKHVNGTAAGQVTAHTGVTMKLEGLAPYSGTPFGDMALCNLVVHGLSHQKKSWHENSYQLVPTCSVKTV